ncbi:MAG: NAD(P)H-hydrate dehydratase [Frankiales bacterium]|nr:NAD(P)H-hydrate dehydratase [Frankiales bacterium]
MPPADVGAQVVTAQSLRGWPLPEPDDDGTKHDRGTVAVVGGAVSTPGAVLLAGLAALRAGAGRLQVLTVEPTAVALGVALPEAMVVGLPCGPGGSVAGDAGDRVVEGTSGADAVVLGPGLLGRGPGGRADVRRLLEDVLDRTDAALVLDAGALTALAGDPALLDSCAARVVLTPNEGELAALLDGDGLEGEQASRAVTERYGAVVCSRGWVTSPDGRAWSVQAGGVGLGTSGSGDVLAGLVGGVLARGAEPAQAAVWGQYLHAAAGDRLTSRVGRLGFLARELLDEVPAVLGTLRP